MIRNRNPGWFPLFAMQGSGDRRLGGISSRNWYLSNLLLTQQTHALNALSESTNWIIHTVKFKESIGSMYVPISTHAHTLHQLYQIYHLRISYGSSAMCFVPGKDLTAPCTSLASGLDIKLEKQGRVHPASAFLSLQPSK